jgi:hypothetical protein
MRIIYMGGEVPSHRNLLIGTGVKDVSINYAALKKRGLPKTKDYLISERYPEDVRVYVDSGINSLRKSNMSAMELEAYAEEYQDWVALNEERLTGATEFYHPTLGANWVVGQRSSFWEYTPEGLFWPVWEPEMGQPTLLYMAENYENIAIPGTAIDADTRLAAKIKALKSRNDFELHGIACAKPDNLRQVPFSTASTMSWLSPMMRGETIVWDGTKLVRYPKSMKAQGRPRYKRIVEQAGLDFDKIMDDDPNEVTRLAIWSYIQLENSLNKGNYNDPLLSDNSDDEYEGTSSSIEVSNPDNSVSKGVKSLTPREPSERATLPVFGVTHKTVMDKDEEGRDVIKDVPVLTSSHASLRQCDTCFVAANCPAFKPQSPCAFSLPVEVKTKDQLRALLNAIIEMQGARVAFARFSEELNGGYPDPNTGQEIDRLFKIVEQLKKLESNNEFVRMTVERQTNGGVLSSLFGEKAGAKSKELNDGGLDDITVTRIISDNLEG